MNNRKLKKQLNFETMLSNYCILEDFGFKNLECGLLSAGIKVDKKLIRQIVKDYNKTLKFFNNKPNQLSKCLKNLGI